MAYDRAGRYSDAIDKAHEAVKLDPNHAPSWYNLTQSLSHQGEDNEAIAAGEKLIELGRTAPHLSLLSLAYNRAGKHKDAVNRALEAVELDKDFAPSLIRFSLSIQYLTNIESDIAISRLCQLLVQNKKTLIKATKLDPLNEKLWRILAWCLPEEAISLALEELEKRPNIHGAVFAVTEEFIKKEPQATVTLLLRLIEIDKNNSKYRNLLGIVERNMGEVEVAIENHKKAIDLNPKVPAYWYALGRAYEEQKNIEEACRAYRQALKLKPGYRKAIKHYETLCL